MPDVWSVDDDAVTSPPADMQPHPFAHLTIAPVNRGLDTILTALTHMPLLTTLKIDLSNPVVTRFVDEITQCAQLIVERIRSTRPACAVRVVYVHQSLGDQICAAMAAMSEEEKRAAAVRVTIGRE